MSDVTSDCHCRTSFLVRWSLCRSCFLFVFLRRFEKSRTAFKAGIGTQERRQSIPVFIAAYAAFARRLLKPSHAAANARTLEKVTSLKKVVTVHFAVKREVSRRANNATTTQLRHRVEQVARIASTTDNN